VRVVAAVVGLLLIVAGCGGGGGNGKGTVQSPTAPFEFSGTAATVDGHDIPAQVIAQQIDAFRNAPEAAQTALHVDQLLQDGSDQPAAEVVSDLLGTEVSVLAIEAELARRQVTVTDSHREIASVQVKASFGSTADKLPPEFVQQTIDRYANFVALDQALAVQPTEEEMRKQYDQHPDEYQRACVRHILLANEADATAVLDELRAGADFAALAAQRTTDEAGKADGGDLGCVPKGSFDGDFEKAVWSAPVGDLSGPFHSEYGYHVVQVTKRGLATYDEVKDDIKAEIGPQPFQSLGIWLQVHLAKANVMIDPRFGVWDGLTGRVLPRGTSSQGLSLTPAPGGGGTATPSSATPTTAGPAPGAATPTTAGPVANPAPATTAASSPTTTAG
jgi:hypothetical protein